MNSVNGKLELALRLLVLLLWIPLNGFVFFLFIMLTVFSALLMAPAAWALHPGNMKRYWKLTASEFWGGDWMGTDNL